MDTAMSRSAGEAKPMIVFESGNQKCGIPIDEIQEIIELPHITHVPMPQVEVEGLINLRGKIVTIIDLGRRCGQPSAEHTGESRIIAVERQGELMGLLVERVEDTVNAHPDDIIPTPGNVEGTAEAEIFRGVYKKEEHLIGILDLDATLFGVAA